MGRESSGKYIGSKPQFPVFQCPKNSVKSIIYYLLLTKGEMKWFHFYFFFPTGMVIKKKVKTATWAVTTLSLRTPVTAVTAILNLYN